MKKTHTLENKKKNMKNKMKTNTKHKKRTQYNKHSIKKEKGT